MAVKGGREHEMDGLRTDCRELHNDPRLCQGYFNEEDSACSLTDKSKNIGGNSFEREQLTYM